MIFKKLRGLHKLEAFDYFVIAALLLIGAVTLYPTVHILSVSLSDANEVGKGIGIFPRRITLKAYRYILYHDLIPIGYRNSLLYTVVGTAINLFMTTIGAYALSKRRLVGRKLFTFLIVFTMYFSGGLIPSYLLVRRLGMVNTIWALVFPRAVSVWNLILMRTYFQSLPAELEESCFLDGASVYRTLRSIILPISKPIIATIGLFYALSHWNSYFQALIYIKSSVKYPLQLMIRDIVLGDVLQERIFEVEDIANEQLGDFDPIQYMLNFKYATIFISLIPLLIIYPFVQKYFVKGIMIGSLKG